MVKTQCSVIINEDLHQYFTDYFISISKEFIFYRGQAHTSYIALSVKGHRFLNW